MKAALVSHYILDRPVQIGDIVEVKPNPGITANQWYGEVTDIPGEGFISVLDHDGYIHFVESSICTPMENKNAR